jgi:hypothetical protein
VILEVVVVGGGAMLAGVIAGLVTGNPRWGFAASLIWLALLMRYG